MAKLNPAKIKEMAREMKEENKSQGGVRKLGDAAKQAEARKKTPLSDEKLSGRRP